MAKLVVVGQGYVGLPLAVRAAQVGYDVVGVETDPARLAKLAAGESYVDDVGSATLREVLYSGRYVPAAGDDRAAGFDVAVITVPTPLRDGLPDTSLVEAAVTSVAAQLRRGATVVLESTTYPGTTENLVRPILEAGSGLRAGADFHLGYSPERIDPGNRTYGLVNTPKVVSGIDERSLAAVRAFFDTIVDTTVPVRSTREAELCKLLENTFRHVNIALVNELSLYCRAMDIDIWNVIDAAATKPFGFMRFTPGPGVGGHCLPIDPSYLSWQAKLAVGHTFRFVELANDVNDRMPEHVVRRVVETLNDDSRAARGSRILLLGLAYKRNSADARESPSARVAELLLQLGAHVRAVDPHVPLDHVLPGVTRTSATEDEVRAADLVVLLTDHDAFDRDQLSGARAVLDTRHILSGPNVTPM